MGAVEEFTRIKNEGNHRSLVRKTNDVQKLKRPILVVDPRAVPRIVLSGCSDLRRRAPTMRCCGCWVTTLHDDEMIDNSPLFSLPCTAKG